MRHSRYLRAGKVLKVKRCTSCKHSEGPCQCQVRECWYKSHVQENGLYARSRCSAIGKRNAGNCWAFADVNKMFCQSSAQKAGNRRKPWLEEKMFEKIRKRNAGNCWGGKDARKRPNAKCRELPGTAGAKKNAAKHPNAKCRELPGTAGAKKNAPKRPHAKCRELPGTARAEKNASTKCREWPGNAMESQKA